MVAAEVIKSMNQQDDDDTYEPKSVRDLKAMFNKPSKPPVPGQTKSHLSPSSIAFVTRNTFCGTCYLSNRYVQNERTVRI